MKIAQFPAPTPKVCLFAPGDCLRLLNKDGTVGKKLFMVCRHTIDPKKRAPIGASNGLYSEENPLFLVNLESGEAHAMPHLSAKAVRVDDAYIVVASDVTPLVD